MLFLQNSRRKRLNRIVIQHGNDRLLHDGSIVKRARHKMNSAAAEFHSMLERFLLNLESRKCRQKRWMNVQDTVRKGIHKDMAEYPHEARQHYESDVIFV